MLNNVFPISAGDSEIVIPADFINSILFSAPPCPPEIIAPAWPIRLPGGAESPAIGKKFYFKVENLKLLSGDYEVEVSEAGISRFKNVNKDVEYYIALETA